MQSIRRISRIFFLLFTYDADRVSAAILNILVHFRYMLSTCEESASGSQRLYIHVPHAFIIH